VGYPKLDPKAVIPDESTDSTLQRLMSVRRMKQRLAPDENRSEKLKEACRDFEAVFINKLWKQMRASVPKDGYLHSKEEDMYVSMFDWEMSRKMSSAGGIGLGDMLFEQLSQTLKAAGSSSGGVPPRVPPGVPVNRGLDAAETGNSRSVEGVAAGEPDPEQNLMRKVDALADDVVERLGGGEARTRAPLAPGYREADFPRVDWPTDGNDAGAMRRIDPSGGGEAGLAFNAGKNAEARAVMDGRVVHAGRSEGLGETVVLEHPGGFRSIYGNLHSSLVSEGEVVRAGRKIAELSGMERQNQPELHFELLKNGRKMDPEELMQRFQASRITGKIA
jgi:Rod binding domain-containing protein